MAVTPAYDVGGFGRLASMKMAKRAEGREERRLGIAEKSSAQNLRLGAMQIKQMEGNLQKIQYKTELTQDLQKILKNVPEGKNRFAAGMSYLMSMAIDKDNPQKAMIAYELSKEARDNQSKIVDDMAKLDEEGAINAYNESIGEFDGNKLTYHSTNKTGKIFEAVSEKTGESVFVQNTSKGLVELKGFKPAAKDEPKRTKTLSDLELEDAVTDRFVKDEKLSEVDARLKAQNLISENKKGAGITMTTDKDGNQVIQIGGKAVGNDLTKGTKTAVQKKLIEANATYSDMKAITRKVEDRFLKIPTRLSAKFTAVKEKWGVGEVSEEDKKELKDYTSFRRDAISSLNAYIKQITGAAMSELEAGRLMKAMPTPGLGLLDGDSPTEFRTKLTGVMESLDRVIARNNYVSKHGLASFKEVGLEQIDGIIDKRGEELEADMRANNPDMDQAELENKIIQTLSEEFGIRF